MSLSRNLRILSLLFTNLSGAMLSVSATSQSLPLPQTVLPSEQEISLARLATNASPYPPGLLVVGVLRGSLSEQAGVKTGDILLALDGKPLRFTSQFDPIREAARLDNRQTVVLSLLRGMQRLELNVSVTPVVDLYYIPPLPSNAARLFDIALRSPSNQPLETLQRWREAAEAAEQAGDIRVAACFWNEVASRTPVRSQAWNEAIDKTLHLAVHAGDALLAATSFNNFGSAAYMRSDLNGAEASYKFAQSIVQKLAPRSFAAAKILHNLGNVSSDRGDLATAEMYFANAISLWEKLVPDSPELARSLNGLGIVAHRRGNLEEAKNYYQRSQAIAERLAPDSLLMAGILTDLGRISNDRGRTEEAQPFHERALALRKALNPDSLDVAASLCNLGGVAYNRGDFENAQNYFQLAFSLQEKIASQSLDVANTLYNLGLVARAQNRIEEAHGYFQRALILQKRLAPYSLEVAISLNNLGTIAYEQGKLPEAEQQYTKAWQFIQAQGRQVSGDGSRQAYGQTFRYIATNLLVTQLKLNHPDTAFATLEQGRAQALTQLMNDHGVMEKVTSPAVYKAYQLAENTHNRAFKAAEQSAAAREQARNLLQDSQRHNADSATMKDRETAFVEAEKAFETRGSEEVRTSADVESKWSAVRHAATPEPLKISTARPRLLPGTLVLEFSIGEKKALLFAVTSEGVQTYLLPATREELEAGVNTVRRLVARDVGGRTVTPVSGGGDQNKTPALDITAQNLALCDLYGKLFPAEVQTAIRKAKHVVLSPDGFLWDLPFGALVMNPQGKPVYLGQQKPLSYTQSLTLYFQSVRPHASAITRTKRLPGNNALIVGNPLYDNARRPALLAAGRLKQKQTNIKNSKSALAALKRPVSRVSKAGVTLASRQTPLRRRGELGALTTNGMAPAQLPNAETEAEQIAALYHVSAHSGIEPTEAWFRRHAPSADVIHLATHGFLNSFAAQSGGVLLAVPPTEPPVDQYDNDGALQAWEVWTLKLRADLVVLSACETGRGAEVTGEGLVGLTRAWQYAGARTIVSSLWKVDDASTSALMTAFHRQLHSGCDKDEALRRAMVTTARSGSGAWVAPYHWAAFVLVGDNGPSTRP